MLVIALVGLNGLSGLAQEPVVQLAPFIIDGYALPDETWQYGAIDGFEVLSQASESETQQVVAALWRGRQLALPPEMRPTFATPMTVVIFDHPLAAGPSTLGVRKNPGEMARHWTNVIKRTAADRETFAINLFDSPFRYSATFRFDLFTLLQRGKPAVPLWLNEGLFGGYGIYREGIGLDTAERVKEVKPNAWCTAAELKEVLKISLENQGTAASAGERHRQAVDLARFLPPLASLFEQAPPQEELGAARWRSAAALFVRWGIYADPTQADRFWTFAQFAARHDVTEEAFRKIWGKSYEEVRAELALYLVPALTQYAKAPAVFLPVPRLRLDAAKKSDVARVLGEWERVEADHLQRQAPERAAKYRDHARLILQRSVDRGIRHPRLAESLGLMLVAIGDTAAAVPYLEAAVRGEVPGPAAYLELARLRLREWLDAQGQASSSLPAQEVLELLRAAQRRGPPQRATYEMLVKLTGLNPLAEQERQAALQRGVEEFPRDVVLLRSITTARCPAAEQP